MLWVYVLELTVGIVLAVPAIVRALDGKPVDEMQAIGGIGLIAFGTTGLLLQQTRLGAIPVLVGAIAIGIAIATAVPELLNRLRASPE